MSALYDGAYSTPCSYLRWGTSYKSLFSTEQASTQQLDYLCLLVNNGPISYLMRSVLLFPLFNFSKSTPNPGHNHCSVNTGDDQVSYDRSEKNKKATEMDWQFVINCVASSTLVCKRLDQRRRVIQSSSVPHSMLHRQCRSLL